MWVLFRLSRNKTISFLLPYLNITPVISCTNTLRQWYVTEFGHIYGRSSVFARRWRVYCLQLEPAFTIVGGHDARETKLSRVSTLTWVVGNITLQLSCSEVVWDDGQGSCSRTLTHSYPVEALQKWIDAIQRARFRFSRNEGVASSQLLFTCYVIFFFAGVETWTLPEELVVTDAAEVSLLQHNVSKNHDTYFLMSAALTSLCFTPQKRP